MLARFQRLALVCLLSSTSALAADGDLSFKDHGKLVKAAPRAELDKLLPLADVKTFEHHEDAFRDWSAFPFAELLTKVYGEKWKTAEELLFTCSDGYQPSVPVAKLKEFSAYLAVARKDQPEFTMTNRFQNGAKVVLGPYYLVWDNVGRPELKAEGAADQPYQVVAVDLIEFKDRFPALAPIIVKGVDTKAAKRGFLAFRKHCITCHTVNGEGGQKGPELNYPVSVMELWKEAWLRKWIENPAAIRWNTTMPPLQVAEKEKAKVTSEIVAYLRAMEKNKVKPVVKP